MKYFFHVLVLCLAVAGCKKYLQEPPDDSIHTPGTVAEVQLLLDNEVQTNRTPPGLGAVATDDIVLDPTAASDTTSPYYGIYTWQPAYYQGQTDNSWTRPYTAIYYDNVALHALDILPADKKTADTLAWHAAYASGLFYRSLHFFYLEETFGEPYSSKTAASALGIPLRLDADVMTKVERSTVGAVYDRIISDLKSAAFWLPVSVQRDYIFRPSRPAAWALLARVLLVKGDYPQALQYADSCLRLYSTLLQYDTVNSNPLHPFDMTGNPELLFQCSSYDYSPLYASRSSVDSVLYESYSANDLRRTLFYQKRVSGPGMSFKGSYSSGRVFAGLAVDEVYLTRAECKAWLGDIGGAMDDLNHLLITRWKTGTFQPYTAASKDAALRLVLDERRKETPFRELRWSDLRRLGQTPYATTLQRKLGGSIFTLPPNQAGYTWWIPWVEIHISGIAQNPGQ